MAQASASNNSRPLDYHLIGKGKLFENTDFVNITDVQIEGYTKFIDKLFREKGKNSVQLESVVGLISFFKRVPLKKGQPKERKKNNMKTFNEYDKNINYFINTFAIRNDPMFYKLVVLKQIIYQISLQFRGFIDTYMTEFLLVPIHTIENRVTNTNNRFKNITFRETFSKYYDILYKHNKKIKDLLNDKIKEEEYGELKLTIEFIEKRNNRIMEFIVEQLSKFYESNRKKQILDFKELKFSNILKGELTVTNKGKKAENLKNLVNRYKPSLILNRNSFLKMIGKNAQEYKNSVYITANYSETQVKNTNKKIETYLVQAFRGLVDSSIRQIKELKGAKRKEESEKLKKFLDKVQTVSSKTFSINYGLNKIQSELVSGNKKNENNISQSYFNVYKNRLNKNIPVNLNSNEVKSKFKNRKDLYEKLKTLSIVSKKGEGKKELNIANKIIKNEINYFKKYGKFKNNAQYIKQYNISPEYLKKIKEENMQNLNSNLQEIKVKYVKGLVNAREKYLEDVVKEYLSYLRNPRKEGGMKLKNIDKNYKSTVSEINKEYGTGFIKKFKPLASKYLEQEEKLTKRKLRILKSRIRSRLLRERSRRRRTKPKSPTKK